MVISYLFYMNDVKTFAGFRAATLVTSLSGTAHVLAIAHLDNQMFVSRYQVTPVSVYDTMSFQLLRQITFSGLGYRKFGLATSAINNYLYISDRLNQCIHRVDLSVTNTVSKVTWSVPDSPWGLSMTNTGNFLVVIGSSYNIIREYTPGGSLVREVTSSFSMWYVAQVNNYQMMFGTTNGLTKVATNGTVIKSFGSAPGSGLTQMNDARCFVVDSNGFIIAADRNNNRILVIDPTVTTAHALILPVNIALQQPYPIDLDQSRGRLYIGEDGGQSRVLIFDGF